MNRSLPLLVLTAALFFPAVARAQSVADAGDGAASAVDSGFAPVTPGPDASTTTSTADGCDGKMVNAPCTLAGSAGFCFSSGVDGSDENLDCLVDSDADASGCNLAASASSAGTLGALAAFLGLAFAGLSRARRRRRR